MLSCSNSECKFWVHVHAFGGTPLYIGDACPWCGSVLDGTPQDPVWDVQPIDVFDERTGKVNLTKVQAMAQETGMTMDTIKAMAKQQCVPCQREID